MTPPLVTPRFLTMFGFSFLVFISVFQLLPVAPYRMLALGADCCMMGRAFIYALATAGEAGVQNMLDLVAKEMRVAMALTGVKAVSEIDRSALVV